MKLYFSPAACSLSPHIVLREAGLDAELVQVDLKSKKTKNGEDFTAVNPKGQVPTLVLDDGQIFTEGPAIVQYLADKKPDAKLAPPNGTIERYRLQEWLNFITSELHKGFSPLFNPQVPDEYKKMAREAIASRFAYLDKHLGKSGFELLTGAQFTVADAYLFTVVNWSNFVNIDLGQWPNLKAYQARVAARPKVLQAMKEEGLVK
jgi:glutathione S-transferase